MSNQSIASPDYRIITGKIFQLMAFPDERSSAHKKIDSAIRKIGIGYFCQNNRIVEDGKMEIMQSSYLVMKSVSDSMKKKALSQGEDEIPSVYFNQAHFMYSGALKYKIAGARMTVYRTAALLRATDRQEAKMCDSPNY